MRPCRPVFRGRRAALALGALLASLAACDRAPDTVAPTSGTARGLPFASSAKFDLQSAEFQVEVRTNELGFRGAPVAPAAAGRVRIAAIGDSFTFGWGVAETEAWPARLEARLRKKGIGADVLNLGSPGAGPREYAEIAERLLPVLEPDLVVVGLVQGDDFVQAGAADGSPGDDALDRPLRERAEATFASFSADERERAAALAPKVRAMFESGGLDPALVALAMRRPGYFLEPIEKSAAELEPNRKSTLEAMKRVQVAADAAGARTIAIGVPHPFYVSGSAQQNLGQIGFRVSRSALFGFQANGPLRDAVLAAGFDAERMRGTIAAFRRASGRPKTPRLFFHWDNRLNAKGHEEMAKQVSRIVARQVELIGGN
jgi:hypothetical protein